MPSRVTAVSPPIMGSSSRSTCRSAIGEALQLAFDSCLRLFSRLLAPLLAQRRDGGAQAVDPPQHLIRRPGPARCGPLDRGSDNRMLLVELRTAVLQHRCDEVWR